MTTKNNSVTGIFGNIDDIIREATKKEKQQLEKVAKESKPKDEPEAEIDEWEEWK